MEPKVLIESLLMQRSTHVQLSTKSSVLFIECQLICCHWFLCFVQWSMLLAFLNGTFMKFVNVIKLLALFVLTYVDQ